MITNVFIPSATLGSVVAEFKAQSKYFTKDGYGPGNGLDRDPNHKIENYIRQHCQEQHPYQSVLLLFTFLSVMTGLI
jgi:hypothetical protein